MIRTDGRPTIAWARCDAHDKLGCCETKPSEHPVFASFSDEAKQALDRFAPDRFAPSYEGRPRYVWGYHSSDEQAVHVSLDDGKGRVEDLFDVALYDPEVIVDGVDCLTKSRHDLRTLIGYANAALVAGLAPLPVPDKQD